MRYWDPSAIVPLLVTEPNTPLVRQWLKDDPAIVTWAWSRVEITGAVERRTREGRISRQQRRELLDRFDALAATWDEVTDILVVRAKALPLLGRHAMRAADAAQLGAALVVADESGGGFPFVCLDVQLADAAEREGLRVFSAGPG